MKTISLDDGLTVYQFTNQLIDVNTFVIIEENEALLVDAVESPELSGFLWERGVRKLTVFLTHEHFDHIMGLNGLRESFDCQVISGALCSERIQSPKKNLSSVGDALFAMQNKVNIGHVICEYAAGPADRTFEADTTVTWRGHEIRCHPLSGHSLGSACYILDGQLLFSGDELLPMPTITRFPGGSTEKFWVEDIPWIESVKAEISTVFPGHGTASAADDMLRENERPEKYKETWR